jgi:hypothetical protein
MSSNKKPVAKYRYRNVDVTKDIGKQIEVRDSTSSRWRKKILVRIKNGSMYYYQAQDLEGLRTKGWVFARIREEVSIQEPLACNNDLYRKAHYGDRYKKVQVRSSVDSPWLDSQLLDVNFNHTEPYHTKEGWWRYARIRAETSNAPSQPSQQKPLQSHIDARFDCIDPVVMKLLAECLGYGAKKYFPYSYFRIPVEDHINHALNHINEHRRLHQVEELNSEDELHLVHALARVLFAISTLVQQGQYAVKYTHPELLANPVSGGEKNNGNGS